MELPKGYTVFDAAEYLKTEEDISYFLEAACEGGDLEHIARAHVIISRAKDINKITE